MKKTNFFIQAAARYEAAEFYIIPAVVISRPPKNLNIRFGIAIDLKWGFWLVTLGYCDNRYAHSESTHSPLREDEYIEIRNGRRAEFIAFCNKEVKNIINQKTS